MRLLTTATTSTTSTATLHRISRSSYQQQQQLWSRLFCIDSSSSSLSQTETKMMLHPNFTVLCFNNTTTTTTRRYYSCCGWSSSVTAPNQYTKYNINNSNNNNNHRQSFQSLFFSTDTSSTTTTATVSPPKQQQVLYMWGTDQFGTLLSNPATAAATVTTMTTPETINTTESTSVSTSTSTSTSTPVVPPPTAVTTKLDRPTRIDTSSILMMNDSSSSTISQIVCGPTETAIVLNNGMCYVCGKNEYGQLGMNHTKPIPIPTCINPHFPTYSATTNETTTTTIPKIRQVALGTNFAAYLVDPPEEDAATATGGGGVGRGYDLYTCGFGGNTMVGVGCLGHGTIQSIHTPTLVESLYEDNVYVQQVVAGDAHCTILTTEQEILTTGSGSYGRLGNYDTIDQLYFEPIDLDFLQNKDTSRVVQIAGGKSFTLALSNDGIVYGWGRNHKGQLGTGLGLAVDMYAMQSVPEPIDTTELVNRNIIKIAAGHSHACCISDVGELLIWGMSLHLEPILVDSLLHTKIVDVVCGQDYTLAIDENGLVYSFGTGQYVLGHGKEIRQLNQAKLIESLASSSSIHKEKDTPPGDTIHGPQRKAIYAAAGWKHAAVILEEEII